MCRPCICILLFSLSNHSLNKEEVIQAFLMARYVTGSAALSSPRKQRGFSDFPVMSGFSLSPAAEQANSTVTLSLEVLIPFHGSPRITIDRLGSRAPFCLHCKCPPLHSQQSSLETDGPVSHDICRDFCHLATQRSPLHPVSLLPSLQPAIGRSEFVCVPSRATALWLSPET